MKIWREPQENLDQKDERPSDTNEVAGTPPSPGNISIKTAMDIRRLLVSIINQLRRKEVDVQTARAIIYASHELLAVFSQVDLEERIRKLEEFTQYGGQ